MAGLRGQQAGKWCVIGDSNSIVNQGEKNRGNAVDIRNVRWYLNFIETTSEWSFLYLKAIGIIEAATTSDHNPILLFLNSPKRRGKRYLSPSLNGYSKKNAPLIPKKPRVLTQEFRDL
ncbi:hypothetical protein V6N12_065006 [Hibiscus sabdariffa]|uniref:Endonuclease/exonuclease/phosphatase domain-containing protein n=1 Tax=Hibiscus sabdariffa TaxID=183260 RepID=A0ABR2G7G0_9ROSI